MWNDLNMTQRNELIKLYLNNGISSLDKMKEHYNSFATGGHLYYDGGPNDDKYSFLIREPEVAVADNTEFITKLPIKATKYIYKPNYGYEIVHDNPNTLNLGEVWDIEKEYSRILGTDDWSPLQALRDKHFSLISSNPIVDDNGNLLRLYHGTPNGYFTAFRQQGGIGRATNTGYYSTPSKNYASRYIAKDIRWGTPSDNPAILELYGRGNIVSERELRDFPATVLQHTTPEHVSKIRSMGYDGIKSSNMNGKRPEINLFDNSNYKNRAAVTYDNEGNIIPLSLRDNFSTRDLRYKRGGKLK